MQIDVKLPQHVVRVCRASSSVRAAAAAASIKQHGRVAVQGRINDGEQQQQQQPLTVAADSSCSLTAGFRWHIANTPRGFAAATVND